MKKLTTLFVIFLFVAGISIAQERGSGQRPSRSNEGARPANAEGRQQMTPEQMLERQTKRLVEELKLNKEQEAKATAINKKYMEKQSFDWSKMRDASDDERTKMREEMRKIQAEREKEILGILNAEQAKIYKENQKKREENRRNGQGGFGGGMGGRQ